MLKQEIAQLVCNTEIDYSQVIGDKILPFKVELDLDQSKLNPVLGENQKFCYTVTGVGPEAFKVVGQSQYVDLSHLVLGICDTIPKGEIVNITVTINDQEQEVVFGENGNVELKTPVKPDPPTGCPGLKFDFGLDKVNGVMKICFELTTTYPIGPNTVCLYGGEVTVNNLMICGPVCESLETCEAIGYQRATVCVPVSVKPFAHAGIPTTFCCNEPVITSGDDPCTGNVNGSCRFTMKQVVCVAVPIKFGATTEIGDPSVDCGEATSEDICTDCGPKRK